MLLSEYRIDVLNAFQDMISALEALKAPFLSQDFDLPGWFDCPSELSSIASGAGSDREKAYRFISQFEYLDAQPPKEILVGAGLFAATQKTMCLLEELNLKKDRFKNAMLALKNAQISYKDPYLIDEFEKLLTKRSEESAESLRKLGLARLHLKQCYRKIPLFYVKPTALSWTWANTKAITKISVQKAHELLSKNKEDPGIQVQIQKLNSLNPKEPLAIVQELAPHLRVNLVFENTDRYPKRLMVKGPIPLFYLDERTSSPLPKIRPPGPKKGKDATRPARRDQKIEKESFIPALRAHRYMTAAAWN